MKKVGVSVLLIGLFVIGGLVYVKWQGRFQWNVPEKGTLIIRCTVNGSPTPPDNNMIHINGTIYYTDSNGSCNVKLDPGFYVVTASYLNQSQQQSVTIGAAQTVTVEINWTALPPPPVKGTLDVTCTVNGEPHAPDNNIITINGQNFATDPNGHYVANVDSGLYIVSASYVLAAYNQSQTQTVTVTVGYTSYVHFVWVTEAPPPVQGTLDVQCLVDGVAHAPDNNIVTINGQDFVTDSNGHYAANVDPKGYTVSASYLGVLKTASTTVTSAHTSYVVLSWQTPVPPPEGVGTVYGFDLGSGGCYPLVNTMHQRKIFYANGLHWLTYLHPGSTPSLADQMLCYKTSSDGINWGGETRLDGFPVDYPDFLTWHFDGSYLHVAYAGYMGVYYRKGVPNADGTITWVAPLQQIYVSFPGYEYSNYCDDPTLCVDSEGCPWMAFYYNVVYQTPVVIKSSLNNGTWLMAPGFPIIIGGEKSPGLPNLSSRGCGVLALNNKRVYALIYRAWEGAPWGDSTMPSDVVYGRLWDGSSWGSLEQVSHSHIELFDFHQLSFVSFGDEVHLVFHKEGTGEIVYLKRTLTGGWSAEVTLGTVSDRMPTPQISCDAATGQFYCFWADGNTIFYRRQVNGVWQSTVSWVTEVPIGKYTTVYTTKLYCSEYAYNGVIGVAWLLNDKVPYYYSTCSLIRYTFLSTGSLPPLSLFGGENANLDATLLIVIALVVICIVLANKRNRKRHR